MPRERPSRGPDIRLLIAAAALLLSPLLTLRLDPNDYRGGRSRDVEDRALRNSSALAGMLGEVRTSFSDIMFIKTERYLHCGVAYVHKAGDGSLSTEDHAEDEQEAEDLHQHEDGTAHPLDEVCAGGTTAIKAPVDDFRGIVGDLHRAVQPWQGEGEAHKHGDGIELLPWFRVMTLSDPHYVRGYSVGGWWLKRRNPDEAARFVEEGLANNPDAFSILYIKGQLLNERGRALSGGDPYHPAAAALPFFLEARDVYREGAEKALSQRPPGGSDNPDNRHWGHYLEDDALALCRMAVLMEKNYGDPDRARRLATSYLARVGEDLVLQRLATDPPPP